MLLQKEGNLRGPVVVAEARVSRCKQLITNDCYENQNQQTFISMTLPFLRVRGIRAGGGDACTEMNSSYHPIVIDHFVSDTRCFVLFYVVFFFTLV